MRDTFTDSDLTPACSLGFIDRLTGLLNYVGLHKSGFMSFLVDSTGMSSSGARRIITDKRPPKRMATFNALATSLADLIRQKSGHNILAEDVIKYLLENKPIDSLIPRDNFDISSFLEIDPVKTSQIIITIDNVAKRLCLDTSKITSEKMRLIRFRLINFCFTNGECCDSPKVLKLIENLFELAKQNLL